MHQLSIALWVITVVGGVAAGCIPGYLFAVFLSSGEPLALAYALFCMVVLVAAPIIAGAVCACKKEEKRPRYHRHAERPVTTADLESLDSSGPALSGQ